MTGPGDATTAEQHRLAAVPSIATIAAHHVSTLTELRAAELPDPVARLGAPPGWHRAEQSGGPAAPARMIVCGPHPDGSWECCETIRVFGFTGALPPDVVRANADCTLRALAAEHIAVGALAAPPGASAVRASGYFTAAGRRFWAQFSTYVANPAPSAPGLLIEHSILTDAAARMGDDIIHLSDATHHAFLIIAEHELSFVGAPEDNEAMTSAQNAHPEPGLRHFAYDATGLQGKRMRLVDDLPTSDAGRPQDALIGVTDVICLDDTPSVLLNLRVHPVGQPDTVGLVEYDQLALYDNQ